MTLKTFYEEKQTKFDHILRKKRNRTDRRTNLTNAHLLSKEPMKLSEEIEFTYMNGLCHLL